MPALNLSIDGNLIACANINDFNVLNIRIHGMRIDAHVATVEFSGGSYPESGNSTYLTWVAELPLKSKQLLTISFTEHGTTSHEGKTIEEMFTSEKDDSAVDFKPLTEALDELLAKPKLRENFSFRIVSSERKIFDFVTEPDKDSFALSAVWNSWQPEKLSVSLHSSTFENMINRGPINDLFKEKLLVGTSVQFELLA